MAVFEVGFIFIFHIFLEKNENRRETAFDTIKDKKQK